MWCRFFWLKGGREAASALHAELKARCDRDTRSRRENLRLNPATSTHRQLNDEQLREAGVPAELIRISLGLEDKEDLIADIANAAGCD